MVAKMSGRSLGKSLSSGSGCRTILLVAMNGESQTADWPIVANEAA